MTNLMNVTRRDLQDLHKKDRAQFDYILNEMRDIRSNTYDNFRVGEVIIFNSRTRPKYLVGELGTVTKVNMKTVMVKLKNPQGRFGANEIRVPKTLVDKS
jgi:hypothetical protein